MVPEIPRELTSINSSRDSPSSLTSMWLRAGKTSLLYANFGKCQWRTAGITNWTNIWKCEKITRMAISTPRMVHLSIMLSIKNGIGIGKDSFRAKEKCLEKLKIRPSKGIYKQSDLEEKQGLNLTVNLAWEKAKIIRFLVNHFGTSSITYMTAIILLNCGSINRLF